VNRLERLAALPNWQAIAKITWLLGRLQLAMQAAEAAAADIRVPQDFRQRRFQPVNLPVIVDHPLALAVIQLLVDLEETALKLDWRYQENLGVFDVWYLEKTRQLPASLKALATTAMNYWNLLQKDRPNRANRLGRRLRKKEERRK
jgi:hypothetical protein